MNAIHDPQSDNGPHLLLFNCTHAECGATFTRPWRLKEHETVHTGGRPLQCESPECGRRFSRRSHLSRHARQHTGVKQFKCNHVNCEKSFFHPGNMKRHERYCHGEKDTYFKCKQPNCSETFKKRRLFKLHLSAHGVPAKFKCSKEGCGVTFDSHVARKAHEKKHAGYRCPHASCQVLERTWGRLQKHRAKHTATFSCKVCQREFSKAESLRKHKRTHASHKPVLVCPKADCDTYFSTTFNLQHHIRKVHLELLGHRCSFPDCPRAFAMRESLTRHLLHHDPNAGTLKKRRRPRKSWQKRLEGHHQLPLVEEDLRRLFALRMRVSRRAKVEANLSGLFSERRIPHFVDPEVNLRGLFSLKPPRPAVARQLELSPV